jgi:4-oxalocrotonate tautomerase
MPVVTVQLYEGRSVEQKKALVEAITRALVEIAKTTPDQCNVIFQDIPRHNWGQNGKLASES